MNAFVDVATGTLRLAYGIVFAQSYCDDDVEHVALDVLASESPSR